MPAPKRYGPTDTMLGSEVSIGASESACVAAVLYVDTPASAQRGVFTAHYTLDTDTTGATLPVTLAVTDVGEDFDVDDLVAGATLASGTISESINLQARTLRLVFPVAPGQLTVGLFVENTDSGTAAITVLSATVSVSG